MAKYVHVVLDIPPEEAKFSTYADSVRTKLTNNGNFKTLNPTLAVYGQHCDALTTAEANVANKVPGAVKAREAAKEQVMQDLGHLRDSVQLAVEALVGGTDLTGIEAIVETAGMKLRKVSQRPKFVLGVKGGTATGSLDCTAPASRARDTQEWEYSVDQKTYVFLGGSRRAKVTFTGLPVGVPLYVRHRLLTKTGYTDWSDPPLIVTLK
jgi:hypothetical protein